MRLNKLLFIIIPAVAIFFGVYYLWPTNSGNEAGGLIPVDRITHGHGLAVDIADSGKVYIATHHGLLLLKDEKDLFQIGKSQDDYMGFSPHPQNANIFFSSGHPSFGGNLGFQKSEDGGFSWKKISNGLDGPVDFHAMAVSPVNADLVYGWYRGNLQRTTDGGISWEKFPTDFPIVLLAADPKNQDIVYAASPLGLFISESQGRNWRLLFDGFVSVVAIHPENSQMLISYSEKFGLAKSEDGGITWRPITNDIDGTLLFIAFDRQASSRAYALDHNNSLYKTADSGETWSKIR